MGSPFTIHAKQRAYERYGVAFSKKQWRTFARTLDNPNHTIRLRDDRLACRFAGQWYLLIRKKNGAVLTFLSLEDATDEDKQILRNDEHYRRINDDVFRVWWTGKPEASTLSPPSSTTDIPKSPTIDELPEDLLQAAEALLKTALGRHSPKKRPRNQKDF